MTKQTNLVALQRNVKEDVVHIYNGILLSHKKNAFESVLVRWMNLEPVLQSEVSQKEKNKYRTLTHIYGIQKDGADEPSSFSMPRFLECAAEWPRIRISVCPGIPPLLVCIHQYPLFSLRCRRVIRCFNRVAWLLWLFFFSF